MGFFFSITWVSGHQENKWLGAEGMEAGYPHSAGFRRKNNGMESKNFNCLCYNSDACSKVFYLILFLADKKSIEAQWIFWVKIRAQDNL